jgi:hypothetical protein
MVRIQAGENMFFFNEASRSALGFTQDFIQGVFGVIPQR